MELTSEQNSILSAEGEIIVDAVAGSGKTSTCVEYTKARPDKSFLYTCFNRSVRDHAESKFPENVEVKNIHSLAYRKTNAYQWEVAKSFDIFDVIDILKIKKKRGERNFDAKLAGHILRGLELYFATAITNPKEFDYSKYRSGDFVEENLDLISDGIVRLDAKMLNGDCPITHNFYLKRFQISNPKLDYDYIIYDESQDANLCMIDVFGSQDCGKLAVGDAVQAIYRWNLAENALRRFKDKGYQDFKLTQSFRFRQDIAELAHQIVDMKNIIRMGVNFKMRGVGKPDSLDTHAFLSRSNITLIDKAEEIVSTSQDTFHFEGDLNKYMFAEGVGIYDVFFLYQGDKSKVKNKFLRRFESFNEYEDFLEEVGSNDQRIFCKLVKKHRGGIFQVIKDIKSRNVEKDQADIVLSTCHKAKGMEYDTVELANDFITEDKVQDAESEDFAQINEEINILYVAATRAKNKLKFPYHCLNSYVNLKESKL